jgi:hypothetical protein
MAAATSPTPLAHPTLSAQRALDTLERALHASKSEWLFLRELRIGVGRRAGSAQRLDAFALNCLPHLAMRRVCYEVKTSRADYLNELRHPLKRRVGMRYSNEFYFVTPAGMLSSAEVPHECGLIETGNATFEQWRVLIQRHAGFFSYDAAREEYCMVTIPAPWRDTPGPTWEFAAAMLRNQRREFEDRPVEPKAQQKLPFS